VEDVILEVLENGIARTTAEITKSVKERIHLTPADRLRAQKRPNEMKIDQIIANALQARRRLCRDGLIGRVGLGDFRITKAGQDYLTQYRATVSSMAETLVDLLGTDKLD